MALVRFCMRFAGGLCRGAVMGFSVRAGQRAAVGFWVRGWGPENASEVQTASFLGPRDICSVCSPAGGLRTQMLVRGGWRKLRGVFSHARCSGQNYSFTQHPQVIHVLNKYFLGSHRELGPVLDAEDTALSKTDRQVLSAADKRASY